MKNRKFAKRKRLMQGLFLLSLVFLAFGLFCIGWSVWPNPRGGVSLTIPTGVLPGAPAGTTYASLTDYNLSLTWPRWLRIGESGAIELIMAETDLNNRDDREQSVQVLLAEPHVRSFTVEPSGRFQASLGSGQRLKMNWVISGTERGEFPGEMVLSFGFYDESLETLVAIPVAVTDLSIRVLSLFGMGTGMAMWFGILGLLFWGAFFILGRAIQG